VSIKRSVPRASSCFSALYLTPHTWELGHWASHLASFPPFYTPAVFFNLYPCWHSITALYETQQSGLGSADEGRGGWDSRDALNPWRRLHLELKQFIKALAHTKYVWCSAIEALMYNKLLLSGPTSDTRFFFTDMACNSREYYMGYGGVDGPIREGGGGL